MHEAANKESANLGARRNFLADYAYILSADRASGRQRFQPRYNRVRRLVDSILRYTPPIQQPAHLVERGCHLYTGAVEIVPALKSFQSTGLREVCGMA